MLPGTGEIPASPQEWRAPMSSNPERVFQHGALKASIFNNQIEKEGSSFTVKRVSFQKFYRDKEGTFKTTSSLEINDLPKAVLVLQKAYEYLTARQEFEEPTTTS
jgi:ribosomal protein L25 (general stress protein Ctc)